MRPAEWWRGTALDKNICVQERERGPFLVATEPVDAEPTLSSTAMQEGITKEGSGLPGEGELWLVVVWSFVAPQTCIAELGVTRAVVHDNRGAVSHIAEVGGCRRRRDQLLLRHLKAGVGSGNSEGI